MSLLKFTYVPPSRLAKEQSYDFIHRYCVRFILLWLRLPTDSWRLPRTQAWRHQDIWICHFLGLHVDSPDSCGYSVQCIWINSCQSWRRTYAGMPRIPFLIRDSNSKDWGYVQTTQDEFLAIGRSRLKIIAFRRSINTKLLSPYENLDG